MPVELHSVAIVLVELLSDLLRRSIDLSGVGRSGVERRLCRVASKASPLGFESRPPRFELSSVAVMGFLYPERIAAHCGSQKARRYRRVFCCPQSLREGLTMVTPLTSFGSTSRQRVRPSACLG